MNDEQIVELWNLFKDYIDPKQMELAAERYVDVLADLAVEDDVLEASVGHHTVLDHAINYYLDADDWDDNDEDF